jgi:cytochrome c5
MHGRFGIVVLLAAASSVGLADDSRYTHFDGEHLAQGRAVWLANCEGCHGYGTAGAPIPMVPDDWQARLEKPRAVLYRHAIEGFFGPDDTMMPPRGGNESLTDSEVRAAVDYMAELADSYFLKAEQSK